MLDDGIRHNKKSNADYATCYWIKAKPKLVQKVQTAHGKTYADGQEKVFQSLPMIAAGKPVPPNHVEKGQQDCNGKFQDKKNE